METTIVYWGLYGDTGKEHGNHYSILGFIWGGGSTSSSNHWHMSILHFRGRSRVEGLARVPRE